MISFLGLVLGGANTSFHTLTNKFVLKELTLLTGEDWDDANEIAINHVVLPTGMLQDLCLAYNISAMRLRMENGFSGNSLRMAPKKLKILVMSDANTAVNSNNADNAKGGSSNNMMIQMQDNTSMEFKLYAFVDKLPHMELVEAKTYLDLSNWDLDKALQRASKDKGYSNGGGFFVEDPAAVAAAGNSNALLLAAVARPKAMTVRDAYVT